VYYFFYPLFRVLRNRSRSWYWNSFR